MNKKDQAYLNKMKAPGPTLWLLTLFQILALSLVFAFHMKELSMSSLVFGIGLILMTTLSIGLMQKSSVGDPYFLMIVNMIFSIGVIMIYRVRPGLGERQLFFYLVGVILYFVAYLFLKRTHAQWEGRFAFFFLLTLALFLVTLVFGVSYHGAKNWIRFGNLFQIQLTEFAKLPYVYMVASWFQHYEDFQKSLLKKWSLSLAVFFFIGLFFIQHELGTAMVFFAVMIVCQFAFERNREIPFVNLALAFGGLYLAYRLFPYVQTRVSVWLNPWADYNVKGYQIIQAEFALAEGSFFGTGIGQGQPGSVPLGYSDFIFATIVEEMGAFMGICLIFLFIIFTYRGIKTTFHQERDFYSALALSVVVIFASQALIIFAGTLRMIPFTGITIPFLTYGGSSLLSGFLLLSILQVASESQVYGESPLLNEQRRK